ncbi:MAG: 3-deoxy-D-manno-octulosonic acid transferase [Xanthobacteraceae bacterium]|nr:3-deoxy-D-manno-octulosonic acid transferase [Xanthobacteraceae bacterium]
MSSRGRHPFPIRFYRRMTRWAAPFAGAILDWRLKRGKEDPERINERRGIAGIERPAGSLVWIHGASVGEVLSILPVVEHIRKQGFTVLVTSGTVTAAQTAAQRMPAGTLHQYVPLDAPQFVNSFLDHWQPGLALIAESEFWPNLLIETSSRNIPLVLVNGRLSERSFSRWKSAKKTAQALLSSFDLCLAQDHDIADRLSQLGAPRVLSTGNLKFDVMPPQADAHDMQEMRRTVHNRPIFLAASTHRGEDEAVIDAHIEVMEKVPNLLTIIVPRHPERGGEISSLIQDYQLVPAMRSRNHLPDRGTHIYVADTIGELGLFYRLAPIVFMGGSLIKHGGQNPIEPAKLDNAILHGPHVHNFGVIYSELNRQRAAATVADAHSLAASLVRLLDDPGLVRAMAQAAHATVIPLSGALNRTANAIEPYLVQLRFGQ